jgi:DNA-binding NarL/FixJ family response regulator
VIRVLIAEDHTVVRDGFVAILEQQGDMEVVAETGNGQQAVALWTAQRPDVTLMDLKMPGLDGVDAIKEIDASITDAASAEVEFIARSRVSNAAAVHQHERSRFVREGGRWFYVDGDLVEQRSRK